MLELLEENTSLLAKPENKRKYENFEQLSRLTYNINETRFTQQLTVINSDK
jgi:hypothetical protein